MSHESHQCRRVLKTFRSFFCLKESPPSNTTSEIRIFGASMISYVTVARPERSSGVTFGVTFVRG